MVCYNRLQVEKCWSMYHTRRVIYVHFICRGLSACNYSHTLGFRRKHGAGVKAVLPIQCCAY